MNLNSFLKKNAPQSLRTKGRVLKYKIKNSTRLLVKRFSELLGWEKLQIKTTDPADLPLLAISPDSLKTCLRKDQSFNSFIEGGDWDIRGVGPISSLREVLYTTVQDIFINDKSYKETAQYKLMKETVDLYQQGESVNIPYYCKTYRDIDEYFLRLERTYESMKREGYKKQSEIKKESPGDVVKPNDEIIVVIDRNGNPVLGFGGTHRTLIAQILGLKKIYVRIDAIHQIYFKKQLAAPKKNVRQKIDSFITLASIN